MRLECDCGAVYSSSVAVLACQNANHGQPPKVNVQNPSLPWVYLQSETAEEAGTEEGLFTVGYYDPNGKWQPESDHPRRREAAARVNYLNGRGRFAWQSEKIREANAEAFDELVDALDHVWKVCRGSRTQSRRIRWIQERARCAIEGSADWREMNIPKVDPTHEGLIEAIQVIFPLVMDVRGNLELALSAPTEHDVDEETARAELVQIDTFVHKVRKLANWIFRDWELQIDRAEGRT